VVVAAAARCEAAADAAPPAGGIGIVPAAAGAARIEV
jgi:hypothetical protein